MIREFGWYDIYFILQGAGWTLSLSVIAFLGGSIIGLPMAIVRVSRHAWVRALAVIYIQAITGVPVLLLLFIFYFGLDRKSFVWGKSVSGRVDRGGRRIIKKKKTK